MSPPDLSPDGTSWPVDAASAGKTVAAVVREHTGVPWSQARRYLERGKVTVDGVIVRDPGARVRAGQTVTLTMNAPRPAPPGPAVRIAYDDRHVVVIDKPAGVSSVPYETRESGTAMDLLRAAWRQRHADASRVPLHIVHRIDKATSGLLAFAKSKRAEIGIARQLRDHSAERTYLCVVHGLPRAQRIESRLVRDRGDGLRGSARPWHGARQGKRAVTHVEVVERLRGAALCQVKLETGRTHQIRVHLAELGHPVVGELVYIRDFLASGQKTIESPRLLLHAATLAFVHPITGARVAAESPLPDDFLAVLRELGSQRG